MKHLKHILKIVPLLIMTFMVICVVPSYAQSTEFLNDTDDITVTLNSNYTLIDGVKEGDLTLTKDDGTTAKAHVVLVKANAKASFRAMVPGYYTDGSTKASRRAKAEAWSDSDWKPAVSLSKMTAEYKKAKEVPTRVLAAINGDIGKSVSSGQAPSGSVILEGNKEIARANPEKASFFFGYKDNDVISIVQRITSQKGNFSEAICGPTYILRNGSYLDSDGDPFDLDTSSRQRTALAYKTNGDVLIITVDTGGITVKQLAQLMKAAGCWNGINMDGGGSTTLLTDRDNGSGLTRRTANNCSGYSDEDADDHERKISSALMLVADDSVVANNVTAANSITTDKDSYFAGDSIKVTASTDSDGAWASLQKYNEDGTFNVSSQSYFWYYVYGDNDAGTWSWENGATYDICKDGECNKLDGVESSRGLPPGNYKVSLAQYADPADHSKGYTLLAGKDITIAENPNLPDYYSLSTDKDAYEVGEPIMVTATAPSSDRKAWVGVAENGVPLDSGHSSYYWYYVEGSNDNHSHYNGETYNLYEQEQNSNGNVNSALIDKKNRTLLSGTFDISVYDNDSHHIAADGDGNLITKTITIYDSNKDYKINYKNNDKTIEGLTPATYRYSAESAVALPSKAEVEAAVEGHDFYGWYTNSSFTGDTVTEIPKGSVGDKTLYAKLVPKTYTVSFDTDGGTEVASQTVTYMGNAARPAKDPEKDEKLFLGWTTTKGGSEAFDFGVPITGDTIVYASWGEIGQPVITFDTQGGSPVNLQTVKSGEKAIQPDDPNKDGYSFAGWVTEAGGSTAFDFDTAITGDITIYASWSMIDYSITYDLAGGEAGESQDNPTSYNVETPTFTLKDPSREGYAFTGWMDEAENIVKTIETGSSGDLVLIAQWKRETSLTTDRDAYVDGQALKVTAYCENPGSWIGLYREGDAPGTDVSYYWERVTDSDGNSVISGKEINLLDPYYKNADNSKSLEYGTYRVILFSGDNYNELLSKTITISENTENPLVGSLEITGYSRDDKKYSGSAKTEKGRTLYEYFYGDDISVRAEVSGLGAEEVWVGVIADQSDMTTGGSTVASHWYWIKDHNGEDVSLNYMIESEISEENSLLPFGLNYWVVMVSGSGRVLAKEPFNYRTYNMDWNNVEWGESAKQNIKVDLEWTTKLANGEDQKPSLKITRTNGFFGYTKDSSGKLVKITEEVLEQGRDYTVSYPAKSVDPGSYTIKITFLSEQPTGEDGEPLNNYYKYLSTNPENYGFQSGIKYYLTEKEGQHVITYELNGGINNEANPELFSKGEKIELLPPSKTGCIFEGWYTTPDFKDGTLIDKLPDDLDEDITVYARWADEHTAAYKITYVLNGGTNDPKNPDGYTGNTDLALRPAKKPRCTFDGWFFDAAFTKPADIIPKGTEGDITVYAKFTKSDGTIFSITTSVIGGSISDNVRVKKGSSHTVVYEPNTGYVLTAIFVDGESVDIKKYASAYTFENVSADHTISVVFAKDEGGNGIVKGAIYTVGSQKYKVTKVAANDEYGEVTFIKAKNKKKVTVPATVKLADGKTYKVTAIAAKAFNKKKIRTITIGKNVKKISKYAFKSSKATKLIAKTKLLKKKTVKGSLKSSKIKTMRVKVGKKKVNRTCVKKYRKIFTKKNAGRKISVK